MRPGPIEVEPETCSTCGAKFDAAGEDWSGPAHSERDCLRVLQASASRLEGEVQTLRAELDVVRAGWAAAVRLEAGAQRNLALAEAEVEALRGVIQVGTTELLELATNFRHVALERVEHVRARAKRRAP